MVEGKKKKAEFMSKIFTAAKECTWEDRIRNERIGDELQIYSRGEKKGTRIN
jgi:hypothetical protein